MDPILSVDVSSNPAQVVLLGNDGKKITVLEQHSFDAGSLFSRDTLSGLAQDSHPFDDAEDLTEADSNTHGISNETATEINSLKSAIGKIKTTWTSSHLIIPPFDYVSLNLGLPFKDTRSINKILNFEVQDVVPFEVGEFLLEHNVIGSKGPAEYDVHVSLIPRSHIKSSLLICHEAGFEPEHISTPSSLLPAVYALAPEYFAPNAMLVLSTERLHYMSVIIDSKIKRDRVVNLPVYDHVHGINHDAKKQLLAEMKLTIASAEREYGVKLDSVYMLSDLFAPSELQQSIGRSTEIVRIPELVKSTNEEGGIASLAAVFEQPESDKVLLTDFRTGEFSHNPYLKKVIRGLRQALPYALLCLGAILLSLLISYFTREGAIGSINSAVVEQVKMAIPDLALTPGEEAKSLRNEINRLRDELKELGSLSDYSPLDGYTALLNALPKPSDSRSYSSVSITGNRITIRGKSKDYKATEEIELALKKRDDIFRKVELDTSGSSTKREISFTISVIMGKK